MDALKSKGQMYDQIDLGKIQKSGFDLSYNNKGTGRIGRIIPTRCLPTLPGDRIKGSSTAVVQFEPLAVPMLANMFVRQEHFYVPNRIVWEHWDKFFTGGEKLDYTTPPPSFDSIGQVFTVLGVVGDDSFFISPIGVNVANQTGVYGIKASLVDSTFTQQMYNMLNLWKDKGEQTATLDLLQPCIDAVKEFVSNFDSHCVSWLDGDLDYYLLQDNRIEPYASMSHDYHSAGYSTGIGLYLSQSPDPFERAVAKAVDEVAFGGGYDSLSPLNEFGRAYVHYLYDVFKIFVGTSSNLDYLNYERVTLSDFYYSLYVSLVTGNGFKLDWNTFSVRSMNGLALRANYAIWYNYYRDQLLEQECPEPNVGDTIGDDELFHLIVPRQRCWSKDTFTTALSNTGTGNVVVPVNTGTKAGNHIDWKQYAVSGADSSSVDFQNAGIYEITTSNGDTIKIPTRFISGINSDTVKQVSDQSYFSLDVLDACRRAQKWLQKALIYGNRPQDRLYTSWGVRSLDARLQLPECLATSAQIVELSVNTNNTTITDAQGNAMALAGDKSANAYGYDNGGDFNRFCEEHGFIMSYLTILPETTYSLHNSRCHSFMDKFDYPTPEFATLGMDAVYRSELINSSSRMYNAGSYEQMLDEVFGYQGRYYDYKSKQDEEHGTLQTTDDMYTFARTWNIFDKDSLPKLSYEFVHCFPRLDMFVVDSTLEDYFRYDVHHAIAAERSLPVCGMYL